ncbi:MAG: metallophosphoesterase family protein, partial [Candidatus Xenobia bacterium]
DGEGIRIGIAHGSIGTPDCYPIANKAAPLDLDYLALGHWHGMKQIDERTWYSGTPEPTAFGEQNSGNALLVEVDAPRAVPRVRQVALAHFKWHSIDRELHDEEDVQQMLTEVDALADARRLLWLRLHGRLPQTLVDQCERISGERFFHLRLEVEVAVANGLQEYRHPLLREMSQVLAARTAAEGEDAAAARRALSRLARFVEQAGFTKEGV